MNFLERALDKTNHFGKLVLVGIIFFVGNVIGSIPLFVVAVIKGIEKGEDAIYKFSETLDFTVLGISQNLGLLLMLLPLAVALFACILFVKILHKRTFSETVNGTKKVRWNHVFMGFGIWFLLASIYLLISYFINPNNFTFQFDMATFLPLLLISVLLIPLQTTCEEFLFRGYLTQTVAAWTKSRWWAIIIPGILFGFMHIRNPEILEYGLLETMPQYIIFGLIFGLVAVMDDGIELSMGMHAANNLFACLFLTFDASALSTPALFHQVEVFPIVDTIVLSAMGIVAIVFFARKYKWDFRIMNKKVEPLPSIEIDVISQNQSADFMQ